MKKIVLTILLLFGFVLSTNAQTKDMSLGAGLVISLPIGDFSDGANLGFGGTAVFEKAFMPQLIGTGTIGYITWGTDADNVSFSAVPVLVGVKYFFTPGVGFYGLSQLGLTFLSVDYPTITGPFGIVYGGGGGSSTEFTFSIGGGYEVPVSPDVVLDFSALFNLISDANNIQFRGGAKFALN